MKTRHPYAFLPSVLLEWSGSYARALITGAHVQGNYGISGRLKVTRLEDLLVLTWEADPPPRIVHGSPPLDEHKLPPPLYFRDDQRGGSVVCGSASQVGVEGVEEFMLPALGNPFDLPVVITLWGRTR